MKLQIPRDYFNNPVPPRLFLCTTGKKIIGELPSYDVSGDFKWGAYSEMQFSIDRQYVDILTGEYKTHPLFDKTEGLRKVYAENIGYFIVQDPDTMYGEKDTKTLSCFSSEYETGSKYLENFYVNTGEVDSKEVIYLSDIYGDNYTIDTPYEISRDSFDAYQSYYIKEYSDTDTYIYQQVSIADNTEYLKYDGTTVEKTLYVKKYPNVRFYWPTKPQLSLLHLVLEKIPGWKIGNVDATLWRKERKFDEERIAVYDFLMNDIQDTFKCVVEWDTLTNEINFYEEAEDGINEDNTIQTRWDTDVFVSRENLAEEINIKYSSDDIKTKLKVAGADDLDIREINLGKNYIMNLDYYHSLEWMEQDLFDAYSDYLEVVQEYSPQFTEASQSRVSAYNKYNDLKNAVPADGSVVLVGDEFKKLYCVYVPVYEDGAEQTVIDTAINTAVTALTKKLKLYRVFEDIQANKTDNILLRLKNADNDIATIRIYNKGTEASPDYRVQSIVVRATSGISDNPSEYTLKQWVTGLLTAEYMGLSDFKVSYIGTMGAYFVLAKDETQEENLQDYGVNLLKEKQEIYTTIFQTQTEAMYSKENYQCTASDDPPTGTIAVGTRWFKTNSNPAALYSWDGNKWESIKIEDDPKNYENYQRYFDNYEKLQAVTNVLVEKERAAEYCYDGYMVPNRKIILNANDGSSLEANMQRAAEDHFKGHTIVRQDMDKVLPLYTFTTSKYPDDVFAVYLKGTTPYVSYAASCGVYQAIMDRINALTDFEKFFDEDQWIRLSPYIREDEFSDDNFLLTGYESEEERLKICEELRDSAAKELKTLCQPRLEFSMNMANILAMPEFKPLFNQFQLGNFVRVHIRDSYIKRARLLEVHLTFDDLSDFNCNFSNLITTKSEIDKHAELLKQAVTAGKQVAQSAGDWQRAVDKSSRLEEEIANGLQNAALEVGKASGQAISWDQQGIRCRKLIDGTTDQYEDAQIAIINNKIVFTQDNWKTSKAALGEFTIDIGQGTQTMYGLLADCVISGYIEGSTIKGGSLEIGGSGGKFVVHEDGSVEILASDNSSKYASTAAVEQLEASRQFHIELIYSGSTIFTEPNQSCIITCKVYKWDEEITNDILPTASFKWIRTSNSNDSAWNNSHTFQGVNTITITNDDVTKNAQFYCECTFDETLL